MQTFYLHETTHQNARQTSGTAIQAETLTSAKRTATRQQTFQGTWLILCDRNDNAIAWRNPATGKWEA